MCGDLKPYGFAGPGPGGRQVYDITGRRRIVWRPGQSLRSVPVHLIDRTYIIGSTSAVALFVFTVLLGAQAPTAPAAPQAPQGGPPVAGRGGLPGTESGWATFQGQCFRCHGNTANGQAPTAAAIRQM